MDADTHSLLTEMFDAHVKLSEKMTALQARAAIDHWIVMRLVATSTVLGDLDDEARSLLNGTFRSSQILASVLKDTTALEAYIGLIKHRVEELSGRPL